MKTIFTILKEGESFTPNENGIFITKEDLEEMYRSAMLDATLYGDRQEEWEYAHATLMRDFILAINNFEKKQKNNDN